MADASSALTFGSREYARKAMGQDFTFGDPNQAMMRELIRQRGTSATHASDITIDPAYQGVKVRELPSSAFNASGPIGPTAYTGSTGKDYEGSSRTTTHNSRSLTRAYKKNVKGLKPVSEILREGAQRILGVNP